MRRARRIARCAGAIGGTILVALALAVPVSAADLTETVRRIKPGIVGVGTFQEVRRPPSQLLGTGFAVGDGTLVLTSNHVVNNKADQDQHRLLVVFTGSGRDSRVVPVVVATSDPLHDVAILRLTQGRLPPLELGDDSDVAEGQSIAFTGFPIGAVLGLYPVTHRGIIAARTPIAVPQVSQGNLDARMIRMLRERFEVFQLDATAYPGNSEGTGAQRSERHHLRRADPLRARTPASDGALTYGLGGAAGAVGGSSATGAAPSVSAMWRISSMVSRRGASARGARAAATGAMGASACAASRWVT
jgi:S1-C subfamily serine protease